MQQCKLPHFPSSVGAFTTTLPSEMPKCKSAALGEQNEEDCEAQKSGSPQTYENTKPLGMSFLFGVLALFDIPNSN